MTELLDTAIARVRKLPRERQDEAAELLMSLVNQDPTSLQLSPEQIEEVERRIAGPADTVSHGIARACFGWSRG